MKSRFRAYGLLFSLVLGSVLGLTACAIDPATRIAQGPVVQTFGEGQGVMALQISGNLYGQSLFNNKRYYKLSTVVVRNTETKKTFALNDRSDPVLGFSFFSEAIPPGRYEVLAIRTANMIAYSPELAAKQKAGLLPNFQVTAGQLTDLGTLALFTVTSIKYNGIFHMGLLDSTQDPGAVARLLPPSITARLAGLPVSGWQTGASTREDWLLSPTALHETMRVANPTLMSDGSVWMGEAAGQIAQRSARGVWSWLKTPSSLPITSFYAKEDGTVIAGNEGGGLYVKTPGARVWNVVPLSVPDAAVIHLGPHPTPGKTLVVLQTRESYIGLAADPASGAAWTQQFVVPRKYLSNRIHDGIAVPLHQGDKFVLATGSVEIKPDVTFYDPGQKQWRTEPAEGAGSPRSWKALPGGDIGRMAGIPLTGMYFVASANQGRQWDKRGDLNWASGSMVFTSGKVGYVIRTDSTAAFDASKSLYSLWRTGDAGRNWTRMGLLPAPVPLAELLSLGGDDALGFVAWDGNFYVSKDSGRTWALERSLL